MREILFRGKRKDNGEWVEGGIIPLDAESGYVFIVEPYMSASTLPVYDIIKRHAHLVDPETVGQYTGLTDKNGVRIFEGDIVQLVDKNCDYSWEAVVVFGNPYGQYCWGWNFACIDKHPGCNTDILLWVEMEETGAECEVIGNIHDNKDILEEGGE